MKFDIESYNKYIGSNDDVIGVSLKKSANESLHGSFALFNLVKEYNIKLSVPRKNFDKYSRKIMFGYFEKIQRGLNFPCVVYEYQEGLSVLKQIQLFQPRSKNFTKSILPSFEFLSIVSEKNLNLRDMIEFALLTTMSISPNTCDHYKAEGYEISNVSNNNKPNIEIERVRIKINGETDTIFDVKINGTESKLQLRSKGSLPQFIYIKSRDKTKGTVLQNVKL